MTAGQQRAPFIALLGVLLLGVLGIYWFGWTDFWRALGVPTMSPPFADMRTVQKGLISAAHGYDPQMENPFDPWHRLMNYPSVWLWAGHLIGLTNETTFLAVCITFAALYSAACLSLLWMYPSWLLFAATVSSASLLAIERGNNDLLVFFLLVVFARSRWLLSSVLFIVAASAKVFPLFVLHAVAAQNDRKKLLACALSALVVLVALSPEFAAIRSGNTAGGIIAYGYKPLAGFLTALGAERSSLFSEDTIHWVVGGLLAALAWLLFRGSLAFYRASELNTERHYLFLLGASVYVYTFVFAANWDYRLIFLLLCIPYALQGEPGHFGLSLTLLMILCLSAIWLGNGTFLIALSIVLAKALVFVILAILILLPLHDSWRPQRTPS